MFKEIQFEITTERRDFDHPAVVLRIYQRTSLNLSVELS